MTEFRTYDHVERLGHEDVDGLLVGRVHVFPKLDGTNASVWWNAGLQTGSRRRVIDTGDDNAGFASWAHGKADVLQAALGDLPSGAVLYGEWLVPHTLKTYREEAWRRFWVFDVYDRVSEQYVPYEMYSAILAQYGIDCVPPLCWIANPTEEDVRRQVDANTYLIRDGMGVGEGIVLKNYAWRNKFGRQPWAKIVRNEFKEQNAIAFGTCEKNGQFQVEVAIAERFMTPTFVAKTRAKILRDVTNQLGYPDGVAQKAVEEANRGKIIPRLLATCYHDLVIEELWSALKEHHEPTINFKLLRQHVQAKVKEYAKDLF